MNHEITAKRFKEATGYDPVNDDLERCNCPFQGMIAHEQCGWDNQRNMPRSLPGNSQLKSKLITREDDIAKVCQTILDHWEDYNSQSSYSCNFCAGYKGSTHPVKLANGYYHSLDCPVLVAQDLLTK